ncbi:hypothetical protein EVAR_22383_1 [Eumeta japonica]|uniref:Uncharacterized protein n=1 Tax=Eumeta variegata TaxID=151549 RepID=A0A4C1VLI5_EUMVA|nr:hypothetical protein EVAR_22383_1 [Eumeta japonica]
MLSAASNVTNQLTHVDLFTTNYRRSGRRTVSAAYAHILFHDFNDEMTAFRRVDFALLPQLVFTYRSGEVPPRMRRQRAPYAGGNEIKACSSGAERPPAPPVPIYKQALRRDDEIQFFRVGRRIVPSTDLFYDTRTDRSRKFRDSRNSTKEWRVRRLPRS